MLSLDVGCGRRRLGDINVDIDRKVKPDIICDAHARAQSHVDYYRLH
jgi:hypothetical protein